MSKTNLLLLIIISFSLAQITVNRRWYWDQQDVAAPGFSWDVSEFFPGTNCTDRAGAFTYNGSVSCNTLSGGEGNLSVDDETVTSSDSVWVVWEMTTFSDSYDGCIVRMNAATGDGLFVTMTNVAGDIRWAIGTLDNWVWNSLILDYNASREIAGENVASGSFGGILITGAGASSNIALWHWTDAENFPGNPSTWGAPEDGPDTFNSSLTGTTVGIHTENTHAYGVAGP
jgi:hypothetical protein